MTFYQLNPLRFELQMQLDYPGQALIVGQQYALYCRSFILSQRTKSFHKQDPAVDKYVETPTTTNKRNTTLSRRSLD